MDTAFYEAIAVKLQSLAAHDEAFREKFSARMLADKNSITQCCSYIIQEVKKSKRTAFTDEEIYGMAIHFFDEGLTASGSVPAVRVVVPKQPDAKPGMAGKPKPKKQQDESQLSLF